MTYKEFKDRVRKEEEYLDEKWGKTRSRDLAQGIGGLPYAFLFIFIIVAGAGIFG
jgi:hypothetical protein